MLEGDDDRVSEKRKAKAGAHYWHESCLIDFELMPGAHHRTRKESNLKGFNKFSPRAKARFLIT
jgi:hypothetical protein